MSALEAVSRWLRCPNCGSPLPCVNGHRFDVARQGYLSLLGGKAVRGDTAAMVAAREAFLGAGHFAPIRDALAVTDGLVVELGAGTAYYLAATVGDGYGIALDSSKPALKRAARAHPRIAAVACDVWAGLPLQDGVADLVLDVFAPRNGEEIARVLKPGGALIVVTPTGDHLRELRETLGLLDVDPRKAERLQGLPLAHERQERLDFAMTLSHEDIRQLVAMGPNAHHVNDVSLDGLRDPARVTGPVVIDHFRQSGGEVVRPRP